MTGMLGAGTMIRASLGRMGSIGYLYDARNDALSTKSILKNELSPLPSIKEACFNSETSTLAGNNFRDKCSKLEVAPDLSTSLLANISTPAPEGSGMYLPFEKEFDKEILCSLIYTVKTATESIDFKNPDLKNGINPQILNDESATHIVSGINWGARTIIVLSYDNREDEDTKELEVFMARQIKKLQMALAGKKNVDFSNTEDKFKNTLRVHIFTDILNEARVMPKSLKDTLGFIQQLPNMLRSYNNGNGKPLSFALTPKEGFGAIFKVNNNPMFRNINALTLIPVITEFERLAAINQRLNDLCRDSKEYKYCILPGHTTSIMELKMCAEAEHAKFQTYLATLLPDIRSGRVEPDQINPLVFKLQSSIASQQNKFQLLMDWTSLHDKIKFVKCITLPNITYIGVGGSLDEEILQNMNAVSYVMFFSFDKRNEDVDRWKNNIYLFLQEAKKESEGHKYYAVDCDIHPTLHLSQFNPIIQVFHNGAVLVEDLQLGHVRDNPIPLAQAISCTEAFQKRPAKIATFSVTCPGKSCNPSKIFDWNCSGCRTVFEYGFDQHVYCKCGKTPVVCIEFKCTEPNHCNSFEMHDDNELFKQLISLQPLEEVNILILGETGVGKSTWINGFINFLTYDTLQDAENGELCSLIPSKFTVYNEDFDEIQVTTGIDDNENFQTGHSSTQEPKVYPFRLENTIIRLIDTPGIGDTRGIEQDQKNFQSIMGTLAHLDDIHGICILLKPNNAKLNLMFRFCIKELLTHLHKDASKNLLYCFTNSRGTFYRPGDTMPALKKLLTENQQITIPITRDTVYCYDSEAFRFLAAMKNNPPVTFPDSERQNFATSWEKSIAETNRMLKYIKGLTPHKINSTVNLNHSRQLVLKLARPLAEINRNIQTNKAIIEDEKVQIHLTRNNIRDLKKKRMMTRIEIEVRGIDHPKTVCSNSHCVNSMSINNVVTTEYVTVCHAHCHLKNVTEDCIGDPGLIGCAAMQGQPYCQQPNCGHHYREHLHIYYDSIQVPRQVEDLSVKESLNQKLTAAQMKERMIEAKNREIAEYEHELKTVEQASVRFAYFLKHYAIAPYNDAIEQYLNHLIAEEKNKVSCGGSRGALINLKKSLESYIMEKEILERNMQQGSSGSQEPPCPDEVDQLVITLQSLKYSGRSLQEAMDCVDYARNYEYQEATVKQSGYYRNRSSFLRRVKNLVWGGIGRLSPF